MGRNWKTFGGRFDVDRRKDRLLEIEQMESFGDFWSDTTKAFKIQKEKKLHQGLIKTYTDLQDIFDEFELLYECAKEDQDEKTGTEALHVFQTFLENFNLTERKVLLADEMDPNNAVVQINAGAGGTESCDWAKMLQRMIIRWSESKGFNIVPFDERMGEAAGIKSCTFKVEGHYAYGLLKSETGIHRLVRISPFDSGARRHTSFASIFISPEIDNDIEIDIKDKDVKVDVYRSGGAGGQSVNTTDSAVRLTHLPTGIVVTCQNERSQHQNKAQAMKVLRSRLYEKEMEEKRRKEKEIESGKKDIEWGGQIRSYVLHPYKLVKDHRTNFESSQVQKILDGHLDELMDAFLRWNVEEHRKGL